MIARVTLLCGEMHHFIANLQYYVMFEVLEGSWAGAYTRPLLSRF